MSTEKLENRKKALVEWSKFVDGLTPQEACILVSPINEYLENHPSTVHNYLSTIVGQPILDEFYSLFFDNHECHFIKSGYLKEFSRTPISTACSNLKTINVINGVEISTLNFLPNY